MEIHLAKEVGISGKWQKVGFVAVSCTHTITVVVCYGQCRCTGKALILGTSLKVSFTQDGKAEAMV